MSAQKRRQSRWADGEASYTVVPSGGYLYISGTPSVVYFPVGAASFAPEKVPKKDFTYVFPGPGERYTSGIINSINTYGIYYASTPFDATYGYKLFFNSTTVFPVNSYFYTYGQSIRCLKEYINK